MVRCLVMANDQGHGGGPAVACEHGPGFPQAPVSQYGSHFDLAVIHASGAFNWDDGNIGGGGTPQNDVLLTRSPTAWNNGSRRKSRSFRRGFCRMNSRPSMHTSTRSGATIDGRVSEVEHVRKRYRAFQSIESNGYGSPEKTHRKRQRAHVDGRSGINCSGRQAITHAAASPSSKTSTSCSGSLSVNGPPVRISARPAARHQHLEREQDTT